jgi:hypothetical protein
MRTRHLTSLLALTFLTTPVWASEASFTADAATTWSARTLRMANVAGNDAGVKASLAAACDGLTGEQMKHEYGKEPRWALAAQLEICAGYDGWAGKFGGSKGPCGSLKKGLGDLAHATLETSPPEVVAAAAALRDTLTKLLAATEGHKGACHL